MATAAGADDGPLITGAMSSAEFREYSDDEIVSSSLFQFPGSRELLGLDAIDDDDQKVFLNPQELIATGPFPDSPSGSLPDSLSDSASSTKRTGTFTPSNMPDVTMDDDMNDDWSRHTTNQYADGDPTLPFAQESDSSTMDTFFGFDNRDDTFMEQAFDFNAASRGHEAVPSVPNEPNHNNGSVSRCFSLPKLGFSLLKKRIKKNKTLTTFSNIQQRPQEVKRGKPPRSCRPCPPWLPAMMALPPVHYSTCPLLVADKIGPVPPLSGRDKWLHHQRHCPAI